MQLEEHAEGRDEMAVDSSAIFLRRTWHSWLRGIVAGLGSCLLTMSSIGMALAIDLIGNGAASWKVVRLDWLLPLFLFSELTSRLSQAPYSPPLFFWTPGRIEMAGDAIELDLDGRSVRLTRGEILGGWTTSHEDKVVVVLHTRGRTIFIHVPDEGAAETMLEQAGVGAGQRTLTMRLTRSPRWSWWEALATRLLGSAELPT